MEYVIKLVCFWKSRCGAFLVSNGIEECVAMPYQKMTDALQMGPENRKRQDRLEKGTVWDGAEAVTGMDKQGRSAGVSAVATSTAPAVAVGESGQRTDGVPTAVGQHKTTEPTTGTSNSLDVT
jgi:hypothetical protein